MTTQTRRKPTTPARKVAPDHMARQTATGTQPQPDGHDREALIRRLAYERYLRNGCVDGHALDDWLAAESSLRSMPGMGTVADGPPADGR